MDIKKQKSIDEINKRIANLEKPIRVTPEGDYITILLEGKSPQYYKRFSIWCRNTLDSEHFENLVNALLSTYALESITGTSQHSDEFIKGQVNVLLFLSEEMRRLSNLEEFNK